MIRQAAGSVWGTRGRGFESRHSDHFLPRCSLLPPTQRNQIIRLIFLQLDAGPRPGRCMGVIRIIVIMEPTIAGRIGTGVGAPWRVATGVHRASACAAPGLRASRLPGQRTHVGSSPRLCLRDPPRRTAPPFTGRFYRLTGQSINVHSVSGLFRWCHERRRSIVKVASVPAGQGSASDRR
jgi:hypothetical protein